ncbi:bifunctional adenosylcobinamide kinase/adenosylcobinamide-phosphate guanylyltransferase [Paenibacillus sp. FSL H8-0548]|uniref:bifunctional adenosylcobinamide kinase/adenosylcobinamide-phosphate guanylyltransferase n=1 Tax=Paenibacillus sp. FSL H8-0548 TaxID=1920422 RepID=UPI00096E9DC7|nr:bifunctional adenosylcobinamide kinase/adenosylcobinamide-phosphate guanylyltransferase [Paenibacillus sp. FSL H8-0548]OMF24818.1 bifunctional adenosylcobinamide kinase/adenosylcobinamide-phosphate guanylyltransferase [Paenibacillus sp. FSL H8-0548]
MAVLVTGGTRSGKSSFAEQYAMRVAASGIYIATCQPYDEEMSKRIGKHQSDRDDSGFSWETIEDAYAAADVLRQLEKKFFVEAQQGKESPVVLLDCLTLWLTNWLMQIEQQSLTDDRLEIEIMKLLEAIHSYPYPLIIVTNEVGDGIVPAYALGRLFRDEAGRLNQRVAAICERVFLVTAGIPIELKSQAFRWDQL